MDRLESCYFCGTGDGALDEYPVVPESLSPTPDEQAAVTLCPSCRRKLASVVKRIADVADADRSAPMPSDEPAPAAEIDRIDPYLDVETAPDGDEPEGDEEIEAEAGEPEASADEDVEDDADDAPEESVPEPISPLQYNKVMRLLENREFPVSVDEFESIAMSAYQLEPSDVESVIRAAVDRGLIEIGEDGETLHRAG